MSNNCAVTVGASSMLPLAGATCDKPNLVAFDKGGAGYDGRSSAVRDQTKSLWLLDAALVAVRIGGPYFIMHRNHHYHNNTPTSR